MPDDADVELLPKSPSAARAILTIEKSLYAKHLVRMSAFGATTAARMTGRDTELPVKDQFAKLLAGASVNEGVDFDKPWLVIEAEGTLDAFDPARFVDYGHSDFAFGVALFDPATLAQQADEALKAALSALMLAMPADISADVKSLGTVSFIIEPETERTIYCSNPTASSSFSAHSSLRTETFAQAAAFAARLRKDSDLQTVIRLLSDSTHASDRLQAFLTAWAGLEAFVNKLFKTRYEAEFFSTINAAIVPSATLFAARLREVMNGKYNIRDKFVVLASTLDPTEADQDIEAFRKLKAVRDQIHTMSVGKEDLPVDEVRNLLRKYLRLHLVR